MAIRWEEMTVAELRKYARDNGIPLSAGINKQGIIERVSAFADQQASQETAIGADVPDTQEEEQEKRPVRRASIIADDDDEGHEIGYGMGGYMRPQPDRPRYASDPVRTQQTAKERSAEVLSTISSKAPAFHIDSGTKAWHNPRSFQQTNYRAPASAAAHSPYPQRTDAPHAAAVPARTTDPRLQPVKATTPPRFGPQETPRPAEAAPAPRPEPAAAEQAPVQEPQPRANPYQFARNTVAPTALRDYQSLGKPAVNELLAQDESEDAEGDCVLLKDGTAFLYADDCMDDETIVYLTAAQVRRFQLRAGDRVAGKIRKRRDGDKYRFMLYVSAINGIPVDDVKNRTSVDSLHVIVPSKRMISVPVRTADGERGETTSTPMLYGQRVYAVAKDAPALKLAYALGRHIEESKPNARLMMLSVQDSPEEVALARAASHWPVAAVDPSMTTEKQRQAVRLMAARAQRLAELKNDVIVLVSAPYRLTEGESALYNELLCLFAGGRAFKEGGSITVALVAAEAADERFARAASLGLTLMPDGDRDVFALDGSAEVRAFQIFV